MRNRFEIVCRGFGEIDEFFVDNAVHAMKRAVDMGNERGLARLEDGPHRLAGNRPFAIIVFAYDRYVSYAFAGGLDLGKR